MFIIYTPPLHVVFGGSDKLSPLYWLIPAAFGCVLLVWASIRVILMRKSVDQARVKDIKGLMMCTSHFLLGVLLLTGRSSPYDEDNEYAPAYTYKIMNESI